MPTVSYKTKEGTKKKKFQYTKKGMAQAKKLAKETSGKIKVSRSYS